MAFKSLAENMTTLINYFYIRNLPEPAKRVYFEKLRFVPAEAMTEIVDTICSDRRPTSGNFPTVSEIKAEWGKWRADHPDKVDKTHLQIRPCESCNGAGVLRYKGPMPCEVEKDGKEIRYYDHLPTLAAWCGDCENWKRHTADISGDRRYTKRLILESGWELWPCKAKKAIPGGIPKMIESIGKPIEAEKEFWDLKYAPRRNELAKQAEAIQEEIPF